MNTPSTLYERLLLIAEAEGMTRTGKSIQALIGVSSGRVTQIKSDGSTASISEPSMARVTGRGYSRDWVASGRGKMRSVSARDPSVIAVPRYHNGASLGPGSDLLAEDALADEIQLRTDWMARHLHPCPPPERLAFIPAWGDSMSPTIRSGNILLIDTGVTCPDVPGVYLIRAGDRLFVKRISFPLSGAPIVTSDNPAERQVDVLDGSSSIDIIGRVLYAWKGEAL